MANKEGSSVKVLDQVAKDKTQVQVGVDTIRDQMHDLGVSLELFERLSKQMNPEQLQEIITTLTTVSASLRDSVIETAQITDNNLGIETTTLDTIEDGLIRLAEISIGPILEKDSNLRAYVDLRYGGLTYENLSSLSIKIFKGMSPTEALEELYNSGFDKHPKSYQSKLLGEMIKLSQ